MLTNKHKFKRATVIGDLAGVPSITLRLENTEHTRQSLEQCAPLSSVINKEILIGGGSLINFIQGLLWLQGQLNGIGGRDHPYPEPSVMMWRCFSTPLAGATCSATMAAGQGMAPQVQAGTQISNGKCEVIFKVKQSNFISQA